MQNTELIKICGQVEDIIYRNQDNGYTVIELDCEGISVVAVGIMPSITVGEEATLTGKYKTHPTYGSQFSVESCRQTMPSTAVSILKYLSAGAIKGIGPATARTLVNSFGEETIDVLRNEPERVAALKGFSKKKAAEISNEINEIFGLREVMIYLESFGIPPKDCVNLWKVFGAGTVSAVEENPYIICSPGINMPFDKAEAIAVSRGFPQDSIYRIRAGISYVLIHNKNNGHTCLPKNRLAETSAAYLNIPLDAVSSAIDEMVQDKIFTSDTIGSREFIFLPSLHDAETYAAARLQMMLRFPASEINNIDHEILEIEMTENIKYAELQKSAIKKALKTGLLILTGGPGTGKTTTLNAIIKILKKNGEKVALAAPTGRAAQRMSQLTSCEAKTIHRLLEVCWTEEDRPVFKKNVNNQLNCDTLIIDELSMIDSLLFESVMKALPMGCRLIMVGDCNQLPSVGAGNVLYELIASELIPVVQLTEIFRQSMKSLIITNAHRIVNGSMPLLDKRDSDFFFLHDNVQSRVSQTVVDLCKTRLPRSYGYSPMNNIQVLCPSRKGPLGTSEINKRLQEAINPPSPEKKEININGTILRQGDKVMQVKNNYNILWIKDDGSSGEGIFNGDVGILIEVSKSSGKLKIKFDDKTAVYDGDSLLDLELAYAVTVHKSQGNEFDAVIIPLFREAPQLCYRNLLYTAVTRAKKLLILVGSASTVEMMVNNNKKTRRYSGLKEFITR